MILHAVPPGEVETGIDILPLVSVLKRLSFCEHVREFKDLYVLNNMAPLQDNCFISCSTKEPSISALEGKLAGWTY